MTCVLEVGLTFDVMLNAIFRGQAGKALSYRAATAQVRCESWGCVYTKF